MVIRSSRYRHDIPVDYGLTPRVHPRISTRNDVRLDHVQSGHPPSRDPCRQKNARSLTDGRYRLVAFKEMVDYLHAAGKIPQRLGSPARQLAQNEEVGRPFRQYRGQGANRGLEAPLECLGRRRPPIIGAPVGFVNAAESKEILAAQDIPHIVALGRKGGSPVAAAIVNALIRLAAEGS